ncbi:MAG: S-layer homology domain-containing protein [Capsulimonadaceae bacterium]|nr:S-layer homology domain-containing protein [Capsulimonadaceae bacterium]
MKNSLPRILASLAAVAVIVAVNGAAARADTAPGASPATPPAASKDLPSDVPANQPAASAVKGLLKKGVMKPAPDGKFHGGQPVTRYELAVVLDKLVNYIEEARKPIKQSLYPAPATALTAPVGSDARTAQARLLREGFVPISSPLLTKPATGLVSARELSTILATVTARLSDRAVPVTMNAAPVN